MEETYKRNNPSSSLNHKDDNDNVQTSIKEKKIISFETEEEGETAHLKTGAEIDPEWYEDDVVENALPLGSHKPPQVPPWLAITIRLVAMNILYILSLENCTEKYKKCYKKMSHKFIIWGVVLFFSAFIFTTNLIGSLRGFSWWSDISIGKRVTCFLSCFITVVNYFYLCSLSPGLTWKSHGTLSRIFFNYFVIAILASKLFWHLSGLLGSKKKSFGIRIIAVLILLGFVGGRVFLTKDDFFKGFNGKRMVEDDGDCHFFRISYNWYGVFDEMLWGFSHLNSNC